LQEEDAEFKRKRHEKEGRKGTYPEIPLYTVDEAEASFQHFKSIEYKQPIDIENGVQATFYEAGHVLGSSMIKVNIPLNGRSRTVLFSGDVGRPHKPIVRDPSCIDQADYILIESTYGDRVHQDLKDTKKTIAEVINSTKKAGGNIIIPSFALERSQEVLYYINELFLENKIPHLMVFLDSPMASSITKVFQKHRELYGKEMAEHIRQNESPFNFPGLKMAGTANQSKAINDIKGTSIIIAGSGMCNGGRVKHHLVNNITRSESTIMFVGYQAIGTLGRRIVDGEKKVRILGQEYPVKARIVQVSGFSSHADKDELLQWLKCLNKPPRKIFVVHGESKSAQQFGDFLREKTGWQVVVPAYQDEIILN
jgi:metallo-beta-lactamase family protein